MILKRRAGDEEDKKRGTGKSSVSSKRRRAAAIHNQSERVCPLPLPLPLSLSLSFFLSKFYELFNIYLQKRRDKINQRMKTLQKLVPNSSKV